MQYKSQVLSLHTSLVEVSGAQFAHGIGLPGHLGNMFIFTIFFFGQFCENSDLNVYVHLCCLSLTCLPRPSLFCIFECWESMCAHWTDTVQCHSVHKGHDLNMSAGVPTNVSSGETLSQCPHRTRFEYECRSLCKRVLHNSDGFCRN